MGHYAAEMMCDTCGNLRCTCQAPPDPCDSKWVLFNYTAIPAKRLAVFQRMASQLYETQADAQAAIPAAIDARVRVLELEIARLREMRHSVANDRRL